MDFNPSIPGYVFEYIPTPLASGGVGLCDSLNILSLKKYLMNLSSHFGSKSNFRKKVTSFVISYIDNITLPNASKNIWMIKLKD